jgi:hypothetical protein
LKPVEPIAAPLSFAFLYRQTSESGGKSLYKKTVNTEFKEYKEYKKRSQEPESRSQEGVGERLRWDDWATVTGITDY